MEHEQPSPEHIQVLKQYFGLREFKNDQWRIIRSLIYDKKDACVIASTGFGKSLIYQFPAVFLNQIVVVICPLIALMQDQVFSLKKKGIQSCFFGSAQMNKNLRMEDHLVVYITPEYIFQSNGRHEIKALHAKGRILLFAIDEAHVLDQWADFRDNYKDLHQLRDFYPGVPIIALTASAPHYLQDNVVNALKLNDFEYVKTALDRPNLEYIIKPKLNRPHAEILPLLRKLKDGSAAVYCMKRAETWDLSDMCKKYGINCTYFHAGLEAADKKQIVKDFRNKVVKVVFCTIAFGMGIDIPDVRLVIHYGVAKSIESYYQETGRAGRDGKPSKCVMFYEDRDFDVLEYLIIKTGKRKEKPTTTLQQQHQRQLYLAFRNFIRTAKCRRLQVLKHLGTSADELTKLTIRPNCCDICKEDFEFSIPPELKYEGIDDEGNSDFTRDARTLLTAVDSNLLTTEGIAALMGELPKSYNFRNFRLKCFGMGRDKPEEYWKAIAELLMAQGYLVLKRNVLVQQNIAKDFMRYKGRKFLKPPSIKLLRYFKEKTDVEFFWQNDKINSRKKPQDPLDDFDLDEEEFSEVLARADASELSRTQIEASLSEEDDWMLYAIDDESEIEDSVQEGVPSLSQISMNNNENLEVETDEKIQKILDNKTFQGVAGSSFNKRDHNHDNCDTDSNKKLKIM